ncbi:T9SS type A sorting domain-containing protein [bacterium]|nr:T9SS type A sorting domain-containing protein [bacterium]
MKQFAIGIVGLMFFCGVVFGQITIESSDFPFQPGSIVYNVKSDGLVAVQVGAAGENVTWNLSTLETTESDSDIYIDPSESGLTDSFPTANVCNADYSDEDYDFYIFYEWNENYALTLGFAQTDGENNNILNTGFEEARINFPFNFSDEFYTIQNIEFVPGFSSRDSIHYTVDGWGEVVLETGTFECLRTFEVHTNQQIQGGDVVEETTDYSYSWWAKDYGQIASIESDEGEDNPNFTMGEVRIVSHLGETSVADNRTRLSVPEQLNIIGTYPNPFNAQTSLTFELGTPGMVQVSLYNMMGQFVSTLTNNHFSAGSHRIQLNVENLSAGTYLVQVKSQDMQKSMKVMYVK